ncbi:MAG: ribonuclease HI family protein [Candidatus Pacebacteria bacterium]|nr:ribonuclease HI family protein [Candidatus Paceibacterota bacterium]
MQKEKIIIFTDGGSRGNPGPAGAGAVIMDNRGGEIKGVSKFLGTRTNNWAEYEAVILGLETARKLFGKRTAVMIFEIKMDSQLVQRQLRGEYQVKEKTLFEQYIRIHNLSVKYFPRIKFTHIPREENERADELANEAMDKGH